MAKPIMAKATAVWLVDNTTLSFKQIADFVEMHELEIQGIADGDVAAGVKGFDPIGNNQLTQEELDKAQADPAHKLTLKYYAAAVGEEKRRGPRYTPLSKRQDRPASILWLVKFHPELSDGQISKLVGTTSPPFRPSANGPIGILPTSTRLIRWPWACVSSQSWMLWCKRQMPRNCVMVRRCLTMSAAAWSAPSKALECPKSRAFQPLFQGWKPSPWPMRQRRRKTSVSMVICWMPTVSSICQAAMVKSSRVELRLLNTKNQGGFGRLSFCRCRGFA